MPQRHPWFDNRAIPRVKTMPKAKYPNAAQKKVLQYFFDALEEKDGVPENVYKGIIALIELWYGQPTAIQFMHSIHPNVVFGTYTFRGGARAALKLTMRFDQ